MSPGGRGPIQFRVVTLPVKALIVPTVSTAKSLRDENAHRLSRFGAGFTKSAALSLVDATLTHLTLDWCALAHIVDISCG